MNKEQMQKKSNKTVFNALVNDYYAKIYAHALKLCGNVWDAGDITQNTFVKAFINKDSLRDKSAFGPWLFRICNNEANQLFRKSSRFADFTDEQLAALPAPEDDEAENPDCFRSLRTVVGSLNDAQRFAVELKYYAGFTLQEIALLTGVSEKRVKSRLYEARKKLRLLLNDEAWNLPERRTILMEKLERIELGTKIIPCMSLFAQQELLKDAIENRKFSQSVLCELAHIKEGKEFVAECDGKLDYEELLEILVCCDEHLLCRISENSGNQTAWHFREQNKIIRDLAAISGTGGYIESIEPIMLVPSIIETGKWYAKYLNWGGCCSQEDDDYGYGQIQAFSAEGYAHRKSFKGFHLHKGEPNGAEFFCFTIDVEAVRKRLIENGWRKLDEIHDRGWGTKGFSCTDLNGYVLEFCEWIKEE